MKAYRIAKCEFIEDLKGTGSYLAGGRWSSKGIYILHVSETVSLAILESTVHGIKHNTSYCLATIEMPGDSIKTLQRKDLPQDWKSNPPPEILKKSGDDFVLRNEYLALKIPSAINPKEYNYLINPNHRDFYRIKLISAEPFPIDNRLILKKLPSR